MFTITWQKHILSDIFEYFGHSTLLEEPIAVRAMNDASNLNIQTFRFIPGKSRSTVVIENDSDSQSTVEVWFCEQHERDKYRLAGRIASIECSTKSLTYQLPTNFAKGKLVIIDPRRQVSLAVATIVVDSRTIVAESESFRVVGKQTLIGKAPAASSAKESPATSPTRENLILSQGDISQFERIDNHAEMLLAGGHLPIEKSDSRSRFPLGMCRSVILATLSACPKDVLGRLEYLNEAPSLDQVVATYWPSFVRFKNETKNLKDVELIWAWRRLRRKTT